MIHQYKLGGYNVVLDVCSGSIHVVDDVAYDIIEKYEALSKENILSEMEKKYLGLDGITKEDILECFAQVEELKESGLYESSTIMIVGDHDSARSDSAELWCEHRTAMLVKPAGVSKGDIITDSSYVSHENLWATALDSE